MPKFLTYQRPAPVSRTNWNGTPAKRKAPLRKTPDAPVPQAKIALPALDSIIRKEK